MEPPDDSNQGSVTPESLARTLVEALAPAHDVLSRAAQAYAPLIQDGLTALANFVAEWGPRILTAREELDRMLRQSVEVGKAGWTMPFNAALDEWHALLGMSSDPASADAAFEAYYANYGGQPRRDLVNDLLSRADLAEWKPLIEEVAFALDAGKYRICVPALIPVFEGVARRWEPRFDKRSGREDFFRKKLRALNSDSFDFYEWSAMAAFVETLYIFAGETKPLRLSRNWILHGHGLPDANLADCLRLLQAIHSLLERAADDVPPDQRTARPLFVRAVEP
jgi:hypothetical protein